MCSANLGRTYQLRPGPWHRTNIWQLHGAVNLVHILERLHVHKVGQRGRETARSSKWESLLWASWDPSNREHLDCGGTLRDRRGELPLKCRSMPYQPSKQRIEKPGRFHTIGVPGHVIGNQLLWASWDLPPREPLTYGGTRPSQTAPQLALTPRA